MSDVPAVIEPASGAEDMATVARLFREYQAAIGVDLCFQGFKAELAGLPGDYASPRGTILLARAGRAAVGVVALRPLEPGICEMKRLYVRGTLRGEKLGRRLAERIIGEARRLGYACMRLDTLRTMHEAHRLYDSLGFAAIAPYNDNPMAGVRHMELML